MKLLPAQRARVVEVLGEMFPYHESIILDGGQDIAVLRPEPGLQSFLGVFSKKIEHPGARAKPFMRPALDAQATNAVIAAAEYMKKRLSDKHSLDTSHIMIDGDE